MMDYLSFGHRTHRLRDQQTKCGMSLVIYCTTARRKSSLEDSHQTKHKTRNCCSSFTLLNNFHWAEKTGKCWLLGAPRSESHLTQGVVTSFPPCCESVSCHEFRDKSRIHNPREAATAIERPVSFANAAMRQGPFDATYDDGILDSSHLRVKLGVASGCAITMARN